MSKKISSKILLNTKNPLPQPVKSPILRSNAKMTKSALVQQKRRSTSTNPLPKNQESLIDTSERRILPNSERRNTITVLFARSTNILPVIAQISEQKLFVSSNTYNNLPCFLTAKMLSTVVTRGMRFFLRFLFLFGYIIVILFPIIPAGTIWVTVAGTRDIPKEMSILLGWINRETIIIEPCNR